MDETLTIQADAATTEEELAAEEMPLLSTQFQFRTTSNGEYLGQNATPHRPYVAPGPPPIDLVSLPNTQKDIVVSESTLIKRRKLTSSLRRFQFPDVIDLNVGGFHYTTSLLTLRKYEDSMLAVMFSGRYDLVRDEKGHIFIDRDGRHFG